MGVPNLAAHLALPRDWTCQGRTYRIAMLSIAQVVLIDTWLREHTPHPVAEIKPLLEGLDPEERRILLFEAMERAKPHFVELPSGVQVQSGGWPPHITDPGGMETLIFKQGLPYLLYVVLSKFNRGITEDEAALILEVATKDEMDKFVACIQGKQSSYEEAATPPAEPEPVEVPLSQSSSQPS